jgi:hypothetical protein
MRQSRIRQQEKVQTGINMRQAVSRSQWVDHIYRSWLTWHDAKNNFLNKAGEAYHLWLEDYNKAQGMPEGKERQAMLDWIERKGHKRFCHGFAGEPGYYDIAWQLAMWEIEAKKFGIDQATLALNRVGRLSLLMLTIDNTQPLSPFYEKSKGTTFDMGPGSAKNRASRLIIGA